MNGVPKIVFTAEQLRPQGNYSTMPPRIQIVGFGSTAAEVHASAADEASRKGADPATLRAVGLHNVRSDWEAIYGRVRDEAVRNDEYAWRSLK